MEPFLQKNVHTDMATKQMLQHLIDKKRKFNKLKKRHYGFTLILAAYMILLLYCLSSFHSRAGQALGTDIIFLIANRSDFLGFAILLAGLMGALKILFDKKEKAEKEFHELRCEIIDRSKDLWKGEAWQQRHYIYEAMKRHYDINLYHETK